MGKNNEGIKIGNELNNVSNWQSCAQKCLDNTECLRWRWKKNNNGVHDCKLKKGSNTGTTDTENRVCGTKSPDCKELGKF